MRYLAYEALDGIPSIVVDGAAHADSLLTLSHWPKSGSPPALRDDLSAQIAFHYLDHPELHVPAEAVSNNHFDQDGLMSVYALVDPDGAQSRRERVIDVARAGDFGTYQDRDSARIAWTLANLANAMPDDCDPYAELLERIPELLDHPERFRDSWAAEDEHLEASEAAIASGEVQMETIEDLDLAIVTVPEDWAPRPVHRFTPVIMKAVHPTAVNNATDMFRVLHLRGRHYEVQYRYETWVQYVSRRPPGRIDLTPLADELSTLEAGDARWTFDGVAAIGPSLHPLDDETDATSAIPPEQFRDRLLRTLATGVSAWDPYD
ncbi:MAG: DUF6687 family protein [Acidimicrobiia bacterium]